MIAREWCAQCPLEHKNGFLKYLQKTGVQDTAAIQGCHGAQILIREEHETARFKLITYWDSIEDIEKYAGNAIEVARLYPEDKIYQLVPDTHVLHYEVALATFLSGDY